MKRLIALALCSMMLVSTPMTVFAAQDVPSQEEPTGSESVTTEDIEKLQDEIDKLTEQIKKLSKAIRASQQNSGGGGGSSSNQTPSGQDNYVSYGGNIVYQAGRIELNGGKSNATFTINPAGGGTVKSANNLAGKVGGTLINCINTSSPGVGFRTARVNYFCSGVVEGDNIAVYQNQDGTWVQLPVVEIRKDHVVVLMTRHGDLAFIRVPALATITG
jgi:hypothetical protein